MHEYARFEFLQFDQTPPLGKTAEMTFSNSYVAKVVADSALSGLYTVEQMDQFGLVVHTRKMMNHSAVTQELRRIAGLSKPGE